MPGRRTHADCEPDKVYPGPAADSQLQTNPAQGSRTSGNRAHPGGHAAATKTLAELQRDMARLGFVVSQIREIEAARQKRLEQQPETGPHAMVRLLARIVGVGVETADMLRSLGKHARQHLRDRDA